MWLNFAGEMYMEMNGVKEICVLGFLGINSWIDIRKKQVALLLIIIFAVCGTVWTIYSRRNVIRQRQVMKMDEETNEFKECDISLIINSITVHHPSVNRNSTQIR